MEPISLQAVDGSVHNIVIDPEILSSFGLDFKMPVETDKGDGIILGVENDTVCVLLDSNRKKQLVTTFPLREIGKAVRLFHGTYLEHRFKTVRFRGRLLKIVTQSKQGPCPILALTNALILRDQISISSYSDYSITSRELIKILASYLCCAESSGFSCKVETVKQSLSSSCDTSHEVSSPFVIAKRRQSSGTEISAEPKAPLVVTPRASAPTTLAKLVRNPSALRSIRESVMKTHEHAISFLNRFYNGMNINPIFAGCESFVVDNDVSLFSLAGLRLLHGWVILPGSPYAPLRNMSFNQLTTLMTCSPPSVPEVSPNVECASISVGSTVTSGAWKSENIPQSPSPMIIPTSEPIGWSDETNANIDETAICCHRINSGSATLTSKEFYALAKSFYESTNSLQMTSEGYTELMANIKEGEVVVLFWRNHFFTCVKLHGRLLALCSDDSFADKSSIVFSVISHHIEEDGFADADGVDVDPTVRYVQAIAGDQFSEAVICAAKQKLRQISPTQQDDPQAVAQYLFAEKKRSDQLGREAHNMLVREEGQLSTQLLAKDQLPCVSTHATLSSKNQPQSQLAGSATEDTASCSTDTGFLDPPMVRLISCFKDIFPQATDEIATHYMLKYGGSLEDAVNAYIST